MAERWLQDVARLINRNTNDILRVRLGLVKGGQVTLSSLRSFHQQQRDLKPNAESEDEDRKKVKKVFKPVPPDFPLEN
jgi:hypothetical protein